MNESENHRGEREDYCHGPRNQQGTKFSSWAVSPALQELPCGTNGAQPQFRIFL
jgi:hypothetical protein